MTELMFFEKGHIYMVGGERLPSVSDLVRFMSREVYKDAQPWRLEAAAAKGTAVHQATELLDATGTAEIDGDYQGYLRAYAAFLNEHEVSWELTEYADYHPELKYAGTIDRYGTVDGQRLLVDIKSTATTYIQLWTASVNLYRMMLERRGWEIDGLAILHLKKDGKYKLITLEKDDAVPNALLLLHDKLKKKPRRKNSERRE